MGYFTIAPGQIESEDLSASIGKRLPQYPLPVLRLARLAVDESVRGKGVGRALLGAVVRLALEMAERFGCVGIVVDAKPGAVDFYVRFGFTRKIATEVRTASTPMFLSAARIRAARSSGSPSR